MRTVQFWPRILKPVCDSSEDRFGGSVGAARLGACKRLRRLLTEHLWHREAREYERLCREIHHHGIAMLVSAIAGRRLTVVTIALAVTVIRGMAMMIVGNIAGKRIGKVRVMVRMLDAIHHRYQCLRRQQRGERHAEDGDRLSQ